MGNVYKSVLFGYFHYWLKLQEMLALFYIYVLSKHFFVVILLYRHYPTQNISPEKSCVRPVYLRIEVGFF